MYLPRELGCKAINSGIKVASLSGRIISLICFPYNYFTSLFTNCCLKISKQREHGPDCGAGNSGASTSGMSCWSITCISICSPMGKKMKEKKTGFLTTFPSFLFFALHKKNSQVERGYFMYI